MSTPNPAETSEPALTYPSLGDQVAWNAEGNALIITDDELLAKLDRPYLSPSTAKAMTSCAARMVAEKAIPEKFDLFKATSKGTAAHLVLERLYGLPAMRRDELHAQAILTRLSRDEPAPGEVDYAREIGTDPVRMTQWLTAVHTAYRGIFEIEDPREVEVFAREFKLDDIKVGGVPFKGFVDRVDYVGGARPGLRTIDYKTGKDKSKPDKRFGDDHGDQIRLYKAGLEAATGERVVEGQLYYIEHGKRRRVAVADGEVRKTVKAFAKAWDVTRKAIDTATFATGPGVLCGWCPLVNSCPAAAAPRSPKDPRENAASAVDLGIPRLRPAHTDTPPAAHRDSEPADSAATPDSENPRGPIMSIRTEDKAWIEDVQGRLNLNSYAAMAASGLVSRAVTLLTEAGMPLTRAHMQSLTDFLRDTVAIAQREITGTQSMSEGVHSRLRGALSTYIELGRALPFGEPADAWTTWQSKASKFMVAFVETLDTTWTTYGEQVADVTPLTVPTKTPAPALAGANA